MREIGGMLLLITCLGACQLKMPGGPTKRSPAPTVTATTPPPGASRGPVTPAVAADTLRAPEGAVTKLTATIRIDAGYVIANNGGNLIANNSGHVIANNGGNVVAVGEARLIANNGGNLVSDNGLGLVSDNGLGLVSDNGLGLVSDNGLGLVSDRGAGLIANNAGNFRHLLALEAPAFGTSLPAAGMLVAAVTLKDGKLLPLGVNAAGQPVYTAYSNAEGGITLYLPPDLDGNVRLLAMASSKPDARLVYGLVVAPDRALDVVFDEETALTTSYVRQSLIGRLDDFFQAQAAGVTGAAKPTATQALLEAQLGPFKARFKVLADETGMYELPRERQRLVFQAFVDTLTAFVDLDAIETQSFGAVQVSPEKALPVLRSFFKTLNRVVAERLATDPQAFDQAPLVLDANQRRFALGLAPYQIRKPSDYADLVTREILASNDENQTRKLKLVLADIGLPPSEFARMQAMGTGMFQALIGELLDNPEVIIKAEAAIRRVVAAAKTLGALPAQPAPVAPAGLPKPVEGPVVVSTLAGDSAGFADGPAALARFNRPLGLALDGSGHLYVADHLNQRIRRIDLTVPGQPVVTVAGDPSQPPAPGVTHLLFDPKASQPTLYFTDATHTVKKLVMPAGAPATVSVIAGAEGQAGFADGPAAEARFNQPEGLTVEPSGDLLVADAKNGRLRRIALNDPNGVRVSTLAGTGVLDGGAHGNWLESTFAAPYGVYADPQGRIMLSDLNGQMIRVLSPDKQVRVVAGRGWTGFSDGFWANVELYGPGALAPAPDGTLVFTDVMNHRVRRVTFSADQSGVVTTIAGGGPGGRDVGAFAEGPGDTARFSEPRGVVVDSQGVIYVADERNHRVRMIRPE